jgi:HPt (histidine-containing phosphotransfer) domain-containing protein
MRAPQAGDGCLDVEHLDQQTGGDLSLQQELLMLFDARSREVLDQLMARASFVRQDSTSLRNLAHQLRGSALAIGAFTLAAAAETLELAILNKAEATAIQTAVGDLAAAHAQALAAIDAHLRQLAAQALN